MKMPRCSTRVVLFFALAVLCAGCALLDDDDSARLEIGVSASSDTLAPESPIELTVKAFNSGEKPILLGIGSSSCWMSAVVRIDGVDLPIVDDRICTQDVAGQELAAGASRVESFSWSGTVIGDTGFEQLEPGTYRVYGKAGEFLSESFITIEVIAF